MRSYIDEHGNKIVRMTLEERGPLTVEQKERLRNARNLLQAYDPDCPPMSEKMHKRIQEKIEARENAQATMVKLINQLWQTGRSEDAIRAADDRDYRNKLIVEYRTEKV